MLQLSGLVSLAIEEPTNRDIVFRIKRLKFSYATRSGSRVKFLRVDSVHSIATTPIGPKMMHAYLKSRQIV